MTVKDMLEWAAERGFRLGYDAGFEAGEKSMRDSTRAESAKERGVREVREDVVRHMIPPKKKAEPKSTAGKVVEGPGID